MFNYDVFAHKALKDRWYVLGPILGGLVLALLNKSEALGLVITITFLVILSVFLIIRLIQLKQINDSRKTASYEAWKSHYGNELRNQVIKVVKDYINGQTYYDAQLKKLYRLLKYSIAHAGSSGFSAQAIEGTISQLVEEVEATLGFSKIIDFDNQMVHEHVMTVVVEEGGEFGLNLIGRHFSYES